MYVSLWMHQIEINKKCCNGFIFRVFGKSVLSDILNTLILNLSFSSLLFPQIYSYIHCVLLFRIGSSAKITHLQYKCSMLNNLKTNIKPTENGFPRFTPFDKQLIHSWHFVVFLPDILELDVTHLPFWRNITWLYKRTFTRSFSRTVSNFLAWVVSYFCRNFRCLTEFWMCLCRSSRQKCSIIKG